MASRSNDYAASAEPDVPAAPRKAAPVARQSTGSPFNELYLFLFALIFGPIAVFKLITVFGVGDEVVAGISAMTTAALVFIGYAIIAITEDDTETRSRRSTDWVAK